MKDRQWEPTNWPSRGKIRAAARKRARESRAGWYWQRQNAVRVAARAKGVE